jgi:AmiR/NasT family two-component response regulator
MSPPGAIQNFRGLAALVLHAADQNRAVLERALAQLGVMATVLDPASEMVPSDLLKATGILFVDADLGSLPPLSVPGAPPIVAVIGHETPSRLLRVHEIAASAFLIKPLRA